MGPSTKHVTDFYTCLHVTVDQHPIIIPPQSTNIEKHHCLQGLVLEIPTTRRPGARRRIRGVEHGRQGTVRESEDSGGVQHGRFAGGELQAGFLQSCRMAGR
jgi:hypothetical protein